MNSSIKPVTFAVLTSFVIACTSLLSGCNTMQGAGKDVSAAGNAVQRESCEHNDTTTKDCSR